jgi:macrodomain Ter protein organizer (MatP/YcbG family)
MPNSDIEFFVEEPVTYTLQLDDKFYLIENVPARVNEETGERHFEPEVVTKLQQLIRSGKAPDRVIETPIYSFGE